MTRPVNVAKVRIVTPGGSAGPLSLTSGAGALYAAAPSHLVVTLVPTGAAPIALNYGADYSIGGDITNGTATLTGTANLAAGILTVRRVTPCIQQATWQNGDGNPSARFESTEDYSRQLDQEAQEMLARSITAPDSDPPQDMTLQAVSVRAGFVAVFDNLGRFVASTVTAASLVAFGAAVDTVNLLIQLAAALSGDYLFAQPTDKYLNTPTGGEANWYRALVGNAPTGVFAGYMGRIAIKTPTGWIFSPAPRPGQRVYDNGSGQWWASQNGWWNRLKAGMDLYQYWADVPTGTLISGIILATGQLFTIQGPGTTGGVVQNNRWEPTDNSYGVVAFAAKNLLLGMSGAWRAGHSATGSLTLAAGTLVGGAIITKMVHSEFLEQTRPGISIWGGARVTGINPYLANDDLQYKSYAVDANFPLHATGQATSCEMVISGNTARCYSEKFHFQNSYNDDMISGSCGDDDTGANLGYVYFQTGGVLSAFNPYVFEIYAKALPAPQEILPDPKYLPDLSLLPISRGVSSVFPAGANNSAPAVVLMTVTPGSGTSMSFDILAIQAAVAAITGYAQQTSKWLWNVRNYNGVVSYDQPTLIGAKIAISQAGGTAAYSLALSADDDGAGNVRLKATASRSGTDGTAGNALTAAKILAAGQVGAIS